VRLVGDIGGTHARFGLIDHRRAALQHLHTLRCADHEDLSAAVESYLEAIGGPCVKDAALAVATPVLGDRLQFTNNTWSVSIAQTRQRLGLTRLLVVNDLVALALAIPHLPTDEFRQLGPGRSVPGAPIAVLGVGTGLGTAGLIQAEGSYGIAIPGEGGHMSFAPANGREMALLSVLWARWQHVSFERLVSGQGLMNIHQALCEVDGAAWEPVTAADLVTRAAAGDSRCEEAVDILCGVLGTAAGNFCLAIGATGGVYLGGGVVSALGNRLDQSHFRERFEAKGRFRAYLAQVPTWVISSPHAALVGLATLFERPDDGSQAPLMLGGADDPAVCAAMPALRVETAPRRQD
jgi:glucokinase